MMLAYFKEYKDGGIERLTLNLHRGHPSELNSYKDEIVLAFNAKHPATLKEARAKIKEITGLTRSLPQIWSFIHKLGFAPRKVGGVPGRVNVEEQERFKKKNLNRGLPRLKQAREWCIS
jgi:transposase